jgi:hypothetical protein
MNTPLISKKQLINIGYFSIAILLTWFTSVYLFAAPPTTKYTRGETLDPICAPGDVNCTVEDFVDTDSQNLSLSG